MTGFTLRDMIINGWPVLTVLLIMSILSVTVIWDRINVFRRARIDARAFVANVIRVIDEHGARRALEYCNKFSKPVASVTAEVLMAPGGREGRERACAHGLQVQMHEMRTFLPILGTIAGTAPFVGLFGTVVGIIRAFQDIARNVGGGPEVVSAGIAEALITTAFGLFVAIPAVMAYNYFVHTAQKAVEEIDLAVYDVVERLSNTDSPPLR